MQSPQRTIARLWDEDLGLTVFLVTLCLFTFVLTPLTEPGSWRSQLVNLGFGLVLLSGVFAATSWRVARHCAAALAAATLLTQWIWSPQNDSRILLVSLICYTLFMIVTASSLMRLVFKGGRVNGHRIRGAVAVYLLLGLIWALAYGIAELAVPGQTLAGSSVSAGPLKDRLSAQVYFSFVTLTTLGYGDIAPVGAVTRTLAITEALAGQLYLAILIARLVSLGASGGGRARDEDQELG